MNKIRWNSEDGGVMTLVAIILPVLLLLSAGGVAGFSLFASHRELQRAADQAALAGGASLPWADPNVLVEEAPFPLPNTEPYFELAEANTGQNIPRLRDLVPDPRAVACAIGSDSLSTVEEAAIVRAFGEEILQPPVGEDGTPDESVCDDLRVVPRIQTNPDNTTPVECTNELVRRVADDAATLGINSPLPMQSTIDSIVNMPLDHVLPAAFTPRMKVTVYSKVRPPLLSFITGNDSMVLRGDAIAYRRIKNAVIVPILPSQRLLIDTGLVDPIDVMTQETNLNNALNTAQQPLIDAITDADNRLDDVMAQQGLACDHLLHNLRQDLSDIYDPPRAGEPGPSARDIVDAAVTASEQTAARIGATTFEPTNPDSLAGEAFVLIGVTVDNFMQPVAATQIPILDMALVSMSRAANGNFQAAVIDAANAHGAFRSTLVK